jgi:hypothetical protein
MFKTSYNTLAEYSALEIFRSAAFRRQIESDSAFSDDTTLVKS